MGMLDSKTRATVCREKSLTRQSELRDADVNVIMERYQKTGVLPPSAQELVFADVSELPDFRSVNDLIVAARGVFEQLPPKVRGEFLNDVVTFLDFCGDEANRPRLEELGLVEKAEAPAPVAPAAAGPAGSGGAAAPGVTGTAGVNA